MQVDMNLAKSYAQQRTLTIVKKTNNIVHVNKNRKKSLLDDKESESDESDG